MRIYLDLCTIQRPLDDLSDLRVRLEADAILSVLALVQAGAVEILSSNALRHEVRKNPWPLRRLFAERVLVEAARFVTATESVEARARTFRTAGMKTWDALHLASAVEGGADLFCTCDDKLLNRAKTADTGATRVVSPLELIQELYT